MSRISFWNFLLLSVNCVAYEMTYSALHVQVNRLECIWISHRHTDHCTGIGALLSKRDRGLPLVTVFCPKEIRSFLQAIDIPCHCVKNAEMFYDSFEELRTSLGIHHWISFRVEHSVPSFGVRLDWKNGFSLVYSGTLLNHRSPLTPFCSYRRHMPLRRTRPTCHGLHSSDT